MRIGDSLRIGDANVANVERWASVVAGGALALYGLARRGPLVGGLLAAAGSALLYRGISGHCPAYHALGIDTLHRDRDAGRSADDVVMQASEESFPASDAPAWTPTTSMGDVAR